MAHSDPEARAYHRRLTARLAGGDGEALALLVLELGSVVQGIVRRILDDPEAVRAVVQETWLRAWRRASAYAASDGEVETWLVLLARQTALEQARHGARPARWRDTAWQESRGVAGVTLGGPARQVLDLVFFSGLAVNEAAVAMQITAPAALSHLREALRKIRTGPVTLVDEALAVDLGRLQLGEIEPARQAVLVPRLKADAAVAAEAAHVADALARFAVEVAPPEPMTPAAQRTMLSAVATVAGTRRKRSSRGWRDYIWPVVALGLAGLVVLQLQQGRWRDLPRPAVSATATAAAPGGRIEKLRAELADAKQANESLRSEYEGLLREVATRAMGAQGTDRLLLMELVDPSAYARGERRGLPALARGLLTTPGIVALGLPAPETAPVRRLPEAPKETSTAPTATADGEASANGAEPGYGWLVFDEMDNRGYLNLYHLPTLAADETLRIWVKTSETADPVAVGEGVETLANGSGSAQFRLPSGLAGIAEILITREARREAEKPSAAVILRGP